MSISLSRGSTSMQRSSSSARCSTCARRLRSRWPHRWASCAARSFSSADGIVRIALNLVPSGPSEDAILPQHIAFATSDVLALARAARERGFRPLDIPANYYDDIEARYQIEPALLDELRELNVMYDRDESGEFLHFYTPPIGTVFLEVVERRRRYAGYGALNAPGPPCGPVPASPRRQARDARDDPPRRRLSIRPRLHAEQREHWMSLLRALPEQIPQLRSISVVPMCWEERPRMSLPSLPTSMISTGWMPTRGIQPTPRCSGSPHR